MRLSNMELLYRPDLGWRRRHVFGAVGLRPAVAQHTRSESELLMRYATGATTLVELGVAEGGSAAELRSVMAPNGTLYLVDPYERGRLGLNMAQIVARRAVGSVERGRADWIRARSYEAANGWNDAIDFLFIDAEHSYERAAEDWNLWSPHVRLGGHVALHDSAVCDWVSEDWGPARLLAEIRGDASWELVGQADSLSVLRRVGDRGQEHQACSASPPHARTRT